VIEYRYFFQRINVDLFIPYLFVDPSLVRLIEDNFHDQFYTDGTRGLHLFQRGSSMYYVHPGSQQESRDGQFYVERSVNFVNQHRGWNDSFYLFRADHDGKDGMHEVEFRKFIGNYPVFADQLEEERNTIVVEVQRDRVIGYYRSLVNVDRVITQITRELPPATDVIRMLEQRNVSLQSINKIYAGYKSRFQDYYVSYQPHWVIELNSGERLFIRQVEEIREEAANELE
jgi:regulatory protein YycH of two-component signal transduction system YycFG